MHTLAVLLLFWLVPLSAAESGALAISTNIQALHSPYGGIVDPIFTAPDSSSIAGYTRCGDSAIWTGHYLAAESFRYKVTGSPNALANARRALDHLKLLTDVTGTDVLARCAVPVASPYAIGIASEESSHGVHYSSVNGVAWQWIGNTSRDQYSGVFFGLATGYDMVSDGPFRAEAALVATRLLNFLLNHAWTVIMPDRSISTTFLDRPDQQLTLLQIGRHMNVFRFAATYKTQASAQAPLVVARISPETLDTHGSYFKFNLDTINLYSLIALEDNAIRRALYRSAYDVLRRTTDDHQNAHFNMIDRALNGPDASRDSATLQYLDAWLKRPARDFYVDSNGVTPACGNNLACDPVPVAQRPPTDFLWQRDPFQLSGGGSGRVESAGIDYILPYWMARYFALTTK